MKAKDARNSVQLMLAYILKKVACDQGLDFSGGFLSFTVGPSFFKLTPGPAKLHKLFLSTGTIFGCDFLSDSLLECCEFEGKLTVISVLAGL